jgi:GntR family transcriptional repressor for pyruvate dehydrogenase complex
MMSAPRRVRAPSASAARVADHVRDLILSGHLTRGQRLPPERDLVSQLGVSRTSVRAGLQALASKGVLVIKHGSGTFVAEGPLVLDSEQFHFLTALHGYSRHDMFEARRTLEGDVAAMAARHATGDDMAAISDAVTGMFGATSDPSAFLACDAQFHRAVAAASHNPILASIVEMVAGMFFEVRRSTVHQGRELQPVAEKHRLIYQAIRARDSALASERMIQHLLEAERLQDQEGGALLLVGSGSVPDARPAAIPRGNP